MAEVKMIRDQPQDPKVAVEMCAASLAWEMVGHSAQPTPRGTPYVGLSQRKIRRKQQQQQSQPSPQSDVAAEQQRSQYLSDAGASTPEHQPHGISTISQRLQRTLHCIDLTVEQVCDGTPWLVTILDCSKISQTEVCACVCV